MDKKALLQVLKVREIRGEVIVGHVDTGRGGAVFDRSPPEGIFFCIYITGV